MARAVLMGDPSHFHIVGGGNPFTRNWWGKRKSVNKQKAIEQWHGLARYLTDNGVTVFVVPPHPQNPGLVYPANAGFLSQLEEKMPIQQKKFVLSNLLPSRAGEMPVYREFLNGLGFNVVTIRPRFEGEAELFPTNGEYVFTYGGVVKQRFVPKVAVPPWKRVYGFRTERTSLQELRPFLGTGAVHDFELQLESHYHGDTVFCSFGERRENLLAYLEGLAPESRDRFQKVFGDRVVPLSTRDAFFYAANSYQIRTPDGLKLIIPQGASEELMKEIQGRGVTPIPIDVSEFLKKGGGAVKCMIGDLGELIDDPAKVTPAVTEFRSRHLYK